MILYHYIAVTKSLRYNKDYFAKHLPHFRFMQFIIHVNILITNKHEQILLVREKKEGIFDKLNLPGGHLNPGEKLVSGVKREALEEIGTEIEVLGLLGVYTKIGENHFVKFIFTGKIIGVDPIADKDEINSLEWYSADEILNLSDEKILNPTILKKAIRAYQKKEIVSLDFMTDIA